MLPHPDKLPLLPTFVLSNAPEVVLRDGGSPAGMTSFAPGAATYNKELLPIIHISPSPWTATLTWWEGFCLFDVKKADQRRSEIK
jgi:hypothetical protein